MKRNNLNEIYFKDFIKLKRGYDLPNHKIVDGEYPVVASTSIKANHNEYKVNPPCVVTGRSGSLGKVQYIDKKCWPLNTSLYVKDFKKNHPRYVYYLLQTMNLQNYNSGAGVPTLNQNHLHQLKLYVHKKEQQVEIASILSSYDDLIENNNKRIEILEKMAEEIYKEWFVRMRFPNYENTKFKKGLPADWEVKNIKYFGKVVTGKTPSTKEKDNFGGNMPFIKTPDMHGNMFACNTEETLSVKGMNSQKNITVPENSICVNCIGAKSGSVSITIKNSQTNQQIHSLIVKELIWLEYMYFTLKGLKSTIELFGSTGSTMTNLSKGKFEKLEVVYPNQKLIEKYNEVCKPIFKEIKLLYLKNINLRKTRDLLLPRLISGQLLLKDIEKYI